MLSRAARSNAKAFNAPILAPEHPNAEVEEMVKDAGGKPVQYGVAQGVSNEWCLGSWTFPDAAGARASVP